MPAKTILHIDFDSFFASVEQQDNPRLRNIPIGVTATNGRTCIIASSREAKKLGIKTGCRTYEAKKIYPSIIFVPADFVKYLEVSKKFLNICKDYTPFIELFSIDELFLDITLTTHLYGGVFGIIDDIKARLKNEIGEYITASFGISYNKLLAKLASGINKPDGVFEITNNNLFDVYKKVKLTDICGIGERIKIRLNQIGVMNLIDLKNAPLSDLTDEFGEVYGQFLKEISQGKGLDEIIPYDTPPVVKSVGRNYCLPKNESDQRKVLQNIYELSEEVALKLRRLGKKARTVGFSLRGSTNEHGRKTTKNYLDRGSEIFSVCQQFYDQWQTKTCPERSRRMVRMISIWVLNLEDTSNLQPSLFEIDQKKEKVTQAVDLLNERFGDHTIRNAFLLYSDKLTTVPNGYLADKYERVKIAQKFS